ncbi:serine/threonine protein kinase [Actinomadura sp. KC345]|uniref:serine/threonine protein kinase n=1 Tax=Actinomadura sp. KC345 TaxID=2530371 RepID=UPI00104FBFB9|nr:serine/threonine protein kinase [Actinomadura sp. KC345]TDC37080.1 serine/threonine protein kinase [Actinomadura sp. KC345]
MSSILVYLPPNRKHDALRRKLAPGESLTFGRGAPGVPVDLRLNNPAVPRLAGEILAVDDYWKLSNFSDSRAVVVENPEGSGEYVRVTPRRASCPIPFEFSRVVFGIEGLDTSFQVYAPQHIYVQPADLEWCEMNGSATISAFSLDQDAIYFLVLVALCEPRLRGESLTAVPPSRQVMERLNELPGRRLSVRAVNFHIDYLAEQKMRVKQPFEQERQDGKRMAVVDTALRFGLVREEHLSLLPARRRARPPGA